MLQQSKVMKDMRDPVTEEEVKDDGSKTFSTFEQCYMDKVVNADKSKQSHEQTYKDARDQYGSKDTIDNLRAYEKEYDCSGICDVPLFYLTRNLSDGPPPEDCVDAILKSFTDSYAIAMVSFALFLMFFFAAIATVPNCCGMNAEQTNKKTKHVTLNEDPNATQNTV